MAETEEDCALIARFLARFLFRLMFRLMFRPMFRLLLRPLLDFLLDFLLESLFLSMASARRVHDHGVVEARSLGGHRPSTLRSLPA
jgi:hypothetical protein